MTGVKIIMKTETEILNEIKEIEDRCDSILKLPPASYQINAPRALAQIATVEKLQALHWVIGVEMPEYPASKME